MSNMAPHSSKKFDPTRHFFRQDLMFATPGAHLLIKWILKDNSSHHAVQLPKLNNIYLCPVSALQTLLNSKPLPKHAASFANKYHPFHQVIDTHQGCSEGFIGPPQYLSSRSRL